MNPLDSILRRRSLSIDGEFVCFKQPNFPNREAVTFLIKPMTLTMKMTNDIGEGRALSDETLRKMREKMTENMISNIERDTAEALAGVAELGDASSDTMRAKVRRDEGRHVDAGSSPAPRTIDPELSAIIRIYSDGVMREHFSGLDRLTEDLLRKKEQS